MKENTFRNHSFSQTAIYPYHPGGVLRTCNFFSCACMRLLIVFNSKHLSYYYSFDQIANKTTQTRPFEAIKSKNLEKKTPHNGYEELKKSIQTFQVWDSDFLKEIGGHRNSISGGSSQSLRNYLSHFN